MNSVQYEELCRLFVAQELGLRVDQVRSIREPNPVRPGLKQFEHQIDLYWETEDNLCLYVNIADAKWRGSAPVDQEEVAKVDWVRTQIEAQKALLITNTSFTEGAYNLAVQKRIALHILRPTFDTATLPQVDRPAIQTALIQFTAQGAQPLWTHQMACKANDLDNVHTATPAAPHTRTPQYAIKIVQGSPNKAIGGPGSGSPSTRSGGGPGGGFGQTKAGGRGIEHK